MILGLDVSTSITGATVMDYDGTIISCEAWRFQNKKSFPNLFSKAKFVKEQLSEIKKKHSIKEIYVEKSLQSFRSGFSSAKTLSTLSAFNGIVSWLCYELWGRQPEYISAPSARKTCGVPKKEKGGDIKKVVLKFLLDTEEEFCYDNTKFGNPVPGTYDRADSLIIARAGAKCQQKKK